MTELKLHPACAVWPVMPDSELLELGHDIQQRGLIETIVMMPDGSVLDGRNRWLACELNGIAPRTRLFGSEATDGDDPVRFVISKNKHRRHATYAQNCFAAEALATLVRGTNRYEKKLDASKEASIELVQKEAAAVFGVSRSGVQDAKVIREVGGTEIVEQVKKGEKAIRVAASEARAIGRKTTPTKTKKQKPPMRISAPYMALRTPEPGEVLRPPVGAPIKEQLAFTQKYGRTIVHPTKVADLLKDEEMATDFALGISGIVSPRHPTVEQFLASLDHMLAHKVQRQKDNGEQIDFPKKARGILERIERDLDHAIERLTELRTLLMERKDRASEDERNDTRERA